MNQTRILTQWFRIGAWPGSEGFFAAQRSVKTPPRCAIQVFACSCFGFQSFFFVLVLCFVCGDDKAERNLKMTFFNGNLTRYWNQVIRYDHVTPLSIHPQIHCKRSCV